MKANFIIGKKQIILASLVLILGVAVYLNWQFASNNEKMNAVDPAANEELLAADEVATLPKVAEDESKTILNKEGEKIIADDVSKTGEVNAKPTSENQTKKPDKNLGDAKLVNAKAIIEDTYFQKANLMRTQSRDEAIDTISTILDDEKLTEASKKQANEKAMVMSDRIAIESEIENLIKAKGFTDCMVYIGDDNASVVVKTDGLDSQKATQIKNIVIKSCNGTVKGEKVSITEIK